LSPNYNPLFSSTFFPDPLYRDLLKNMNNFESVIQRIKEADLNGLKTLEGSFNSIANKSQFSNINSKQARSEFHKNLRLDLTDFAFDKLGVKFQVQFRDEHRDQFGKYYERIRITWKKSIDHGFVLNCSELLNC
jgi:hypothetical protein